jgi:hypothetical protein
MSFPLNKLRELLAPVAASSTGVVTSITSGQVSIATYSGAIVASYSGVLNKGDRVAVSNGVATKIAPVAIAVRV